MEKRTIILLVVLLLVVVAGMFAFSYFQRQAIDETDVEFIEDVDGQVAGDGAFGIQRIEVKRFYENGTHTLVGEVTLPTPCHDLSVDTLIRESMPEQVSINLTTETTAEMCAQVLTNRRFQVEVAVDRMASFNANLNGVPVELNIVEALPGETLDNIEDFFKG